MSVMLEELYRKYDRIQKQIVYEQKKILANTGNPFTLQQLVIKRNKILQKINEASPNKLIEIFKETIPIEVINKIIENGKTDGFEDNINQLPSLEEFNTLISNLIRTDKSLYTQEKSYFDRLQNLYTLMRKNSIIKLIVEFKETIPIEVINKIIENGKTDGFEDNINQLPSLEEFNTLISNLIRTDKSLYTQEKSYFDRLQNLYTLIAKEAIPKAQADTDNQPLANDGITIEKGGGRRKVSSRRKTKKYRKSNKKSKKKKKKSKRKKKTKKSRN